MTELITLSGQGGFDPETGELVSDNIADQTAQVFRNIEVLLRAAGASLDDVVSCLVHLSDLGQSARVDDCCNIRGCPQSSLTFHACPL
jgi:2-iminobutanoate/2-iminopropanoate deaminase